MTYAVSATQHASQKRQNWNESDPIVPNIDPMPA